MSNEARSRNTGSLSGTDRVSGRLRQNLPTPTEPSGERRTAAAASAPAVASAAQQQTLVRSLSRAEFNTAIVHFYRGEVQRANTWRNRLDTTSNWAVLTAAGTLSFAFSAPANPHFVILINSVLVAFFLYMEARRYRYYEIWSSRIRVIETGYFAQMLAPDAVAPDEEWSAHLAADLLTPHFTISMWEAAGRRLRRNYLWIFALLAASWNLKVYLHPTPARHFQEYVERATVGLVPGWFVLTVGVVFNLAVVVFAVATARLREATGEVLPRHQFSLRPLRRVKNWTRQATSPRLSTRSRRAARARQRVRTTSGTANASVGTTTGEFKRPDKTHAPEEILTQ